MGDVIQIRDHQSRRQREQAVAALEAHALEIMNVALMGEPVPFGQEPVVYIAIPYGGQGIDGMDFDTAPSEYCAPPEDCA